MGNICLAFLILEVVNFAQIVWIWFLSSALKESVPVDYGNVNET